MIANAKPKLDASFARQTAPSVCRLAEQPLVMALMRGDQQAYSNLVSKHWKSMARVARGVLRDETLAAEVVQGTWETFFLQLPKFRGESALSTWIYRILVHRAKRMGQSERRFAQISLPARTAKGQDRLDSLDESTNLGPWHSPVHGRMPLNPESDAITKQGLAILARELEQLPVSQRVVVTLRDVETVDSREVCALLGISESNQRVLLHRGRARLRRAIEAAETVPHPKNRKSRRATSRS